MAVSRIENGVTATGLDDDDLPWLRVKHGDRSDAVTNVAARSQRKLVFVTRIAPNHLGYTV
jgi:hypothetical protein